MRTSENAVWAKFAEGPFYEIRRIGVGAPDPRRHVKSIAQPRWSRDTHIRFSVLITATLKMAGRRKRETAEAPAKCLDSGLFDGDGVSVLRACGG
jgi:hypothetical protein